MTDMQGLPPSRPLPPHRRYASRHQLVEVVSGSGHKKRGLLTASIAVALVLVSSGIGVALLRSAPITDKSTARCYTVADVGSGNSFDGTTVAAAGTPGSSTQVDNALAVCSDLWRQGFLVSGASTIERPSSGFSATVPSLVACTLPNGTAGIFPGDASTCSKLGLPSAAQ